MGYKLTRKVYETVAPGLYAAKIKEIEEQDHEEYGPQIHFTFELEGSDVTLQAWASAKLTNKSKLGAWVENILGSPLPEELDIESLEGKACNILVTVIRKGDGTEVNKVTEVTKKLKAAPRPQPQPIPVIGEEEGVEELETGRLG